MANAHLSMPNITLLCSNITIANVDTVHKRGRKFEISMDEFNVFGEMDLLKKGFLLFFLLWKSDVLGIRLRPNSPGT